MASSKVSAWFIAYSIWVSWCYTEEIIQVDKCAQAGSWSSSWLQLPQPTLAWPTEAVMLRAYTTQNVILIIMLILRLLTLVCCCLCIHQTPLTWTYSKLMWFDFLLVKRLRNPSCDCIKAFQQTSRKTKTIKHHHMPLLQITSNIFIICDILDFLFIFVFASHFCELCKI